MFKKSHGPKFKTKKKYILYLNIDRVNIQVACHHMRSCNIKSGGQSKKNSVFQLTEAGNQRPADSLVVVIVLREIIFESNNECNKWQATITNNNHIVCLFVGLPNGNNATKFFIFGQIHGAFTETETFV